MCYLYCFESLPKYHLGDGYYPECLPDTSDEIIEKDTYEEFED